MVMRSAGTWSARMTNTVEGGGSSKVFNNAGPASLTRWKSCSTSTLRVASKGLVDANRVTSRAVSMLMAAPSRSTSITSGWTPARTRRQESHVPSGPSPAWLAGHSRAAAKLRAAAPLPAPGGPTNR